MKSKWTVVGGIVAALVLVLTVGLTQAQGPQPPEGDVQPQDQAAMLALMGTAFTYQGRLVKDGSPVNSACDFQFSLWNAAGSGSPPTGGTQIGSTQTKTNVSVSNGLFTISTLDFGASSFNGDGRWLQIAVRCPAGSGAYTTLSPRQALTPAPYALALPGLWTQQHATSPNVIGGYSGNTVDSGVFGATIGGGGTSSHVNRVTNAYGTVAGGYENRAGWVSTVGGGATNVASGTGAFIGGGGFDGTIQDGNEATGAAATIGGGVGNTASGGHATIGGGVYNQVTGLWDATVGGGYGNIAEGRGSAIPGGIQARTTSFGQLAYASGQFANAGDAQTSIFVVRGTTSDDTWHSLYLDGVDTQIIVTVGRTMAFDILVVGRSQTTNKSNGYLITGVVEHVSGAPQEWHTVTTLHQDDTGWGVQVMVAADGGLHVQVNGDTGDTVRWVAVVRTAEVSW